MLLSPPQPLPSLPTLPCLICKQTLTPPFTSSMGYLKWFTPSPELFIERVLNYVRWTERCRELREDSKEDFLFLFHNGEVKTGICFSCLKAHCTQLSQLLAPNS